MGRISLWMWIVLLINNVISSTQWTEFLITSDARPESWADKFANPGFQQYLNIIIRKLKCSSGMSLSLAVCLVLIEAPTMCLYDRLLACSDAVFLAVVSPCHFVCFWFLSPHRPLLCMCDHCINLIPSSPEQTCERLMHVQMEGSPLRIVAVISFSSLLSAPSHPMCHLLPSVQG